MRRVRKWSRTCELACCLLLSMLALPARSIEVHEDVNEGPIGAHLRLNVSTDPPNVDPGPTAPTTDERNVNDPPVPPSLPSLPVVVTGGSDNFTATTATTPFPSNHRQQHSDRVNIPTVPRPTTSSATPEATGRPTTPPSPRASGPAPPATRTPTPGLSSFRAANVNVAIVNDRSAQHQISGYRKRQLYASAVQQRNSSSRFGSEPQSTSEGQFAKEFVPSPEVVPFFQGEDSPQSSVRGRLGTAQGTQGFVPTSGGAGVIDAPYPGTGGLTEGDSRWYGGFGPTRPVVGADEPPAGKWDPRFVVWHRPQEQPRAVAVQFPQDARTVPAIPPPLKGKWKWIPEADEEPAEPKPSTGTPFSSSAVSLAAGEPFSPGPAEEPHAVYFGKYVHLHSLKPHPYSFERGQPGETGSSGTFSSDGVATVATAGGSGNTSSETAADGEQGSPNAGSGPTDVKLVGKEDAHFKSVSPWKKIVHVLSAAIPIGLLISALTPQVVYINPNATQPPIQLQTPTPISGAGPAGGGLRQRSLEVDGARMLLAARGLGSDPVALVKLFHKLAALERDVAQPAPGEGFDGSNTVASQRPGQPGLQGCDWSLLCQLTRQGMLPESGALHKTLWKIANETPSETLGPLGLEEVFRTIRSGDCGRLQRTCDQDSESPAGQ